MSQIPTPPPASDTTESQYESVPQQPGWPKPVGIISIVWGSLGAFCGLCGVLSPFLRGMMPQPPEGQGPPPDLMHPNIFQTVSQVIGLGVAILLITAGILTVKRKPIGRPLHLIYALLSLAVLAIAIIGGLQQMQVVAQWAKDNPANPAASSMPMIMIVSLIFGILLGAAWPVFCIFWFGIIKNKADSMGVAVQKDYI